MSRPTVRAALTALLGTLVAATAVVVAAPSGSAAAAPTRIMALGDSITGSPGCWRATLWNRLQSTGYTNIDMVGTLPAQGAGSPTTATTRATAASWPPTSPTRTSWSAGCRPPCRTSC
ncbi:hypothetical protein ACFQZ4_10315 [Catellatospora coxensis]